MELDRPNPADHMLMFKKSLWITEYSTRMQRMLKGEKLPPLRIDAEPHRRCNLKCVHCARELADYNINEYSKGVEVPEERWYEIAHESGEMGVKAWNIAGIGEPMFKPEMTMQLMEIIKSHRMFGELTTNGWYWSDEHIEKAVKMGWDCVSISIDGPDAASHEAIRRMPESFERACDTVRRFAAMRKKHKTHLPNLTINVVLSKYNYDKLPELVEMTHRLGADVLFVEPMVVYSDFQREHVMATAEQRKVLEAGIDKALELAKEKNIYAFITCMDGDDEEKEFNADFVEKGGQMKDVIMEGTKAQVEEYMGESTTPDQSGDVRDSSPSAALEGVRAEVQASGDEKPDVRGPKKFQDDQEFVRSIMNIPCYYPWLYMIITAEGNVMHCGECDVPKENIKESGLSEIWWGADLQGYRDRHTKGELSSFCERCRPNVIGDMKIVRKSINEYYDISSLQEKVVKLMEHSLNLKRHIYNQEYGGLLHPIKNRLYKFKKSKAQEAAEEMKVMNI